MKFREKIWYKLSALVPRDFAYWCAIRVWAYATMGRWGNTDCTTLTVLEAMDRWKMDNSDDNDD